MTSTHVYIRKQAHNIIDEKTVDDDFIGMAANRLD